MRTTRTLIAALILCPVVAGCAGSAPKQTPIPPQATVPATPSPSASPALSLPAHRAWCTESLVERHAGQSGPLQSDPQPTACLGLSDGDFLDAYYKALNEVNRKALDARRSARPTG